MLLSAIGGMLLWLIDLHAVICLALALAFSLTLLFLIFLLSLASAALALEILALLPVLLLDSSSTLDTSHDLVIAVSSTVGARSFSKLLLILLVSFLRAVFLAVGREIGLWLLWWKLRWRRLLRIPGKSQSVTTNAHCFIFVNPYHLIAKRVTRGFSARTFLRTRS